MTKSMSFFIGLRYTLSKRDQRYISFVSMFSVGSMAIGVAALIIVLSVMNGFDKEIKGRLLKVMPHLVVIFDDTLTPKTYLQLRNSVLDQGNVETVEPLVRSFAMLSANGQKVGAELRNLNSDNPAFLGLSENLIEGALSNLDQGNFGVLIGSPMARKLGVVIGDRITLVLPSLTVSPVGMFPRTKMVHVAGVFQVGAQVDAATIMMHQRDIQKILRLGNNFHGLQISLTDPFLAEANRKEFEAIFSLEAQWISWQQSMATLFRAMEMEKRVV
ncbi:MAG: lipoprotein-releasing system transmembrane subunit LolC, partial [Porticoccaceae bacterium]|nr:lipoprotein-releasing system transmembrane subunit LolC [Porticoccaceae bacterium]